MTSNYTIIKLSLYSITNQKGSTLWHCIYDSSRISLGVSYFSNKYNSLIKLFEKDNIIFDKDDMIMDVTMYSYRNKGVNDIFWKEAVYNDNIGVMIRGFKCYKELKRKLSKYYIVEADVVKDFIKVI